MKKTIIDINEMSDSKELYSQKPNPATSWFVYSLLTILLVSIVYSFFGKIEVVASASGIIRPNNDVSTVSSLISGRIIAVYYTDGQFVQEGDALLDIDMSETKLTVGMMAASKEKLQRQKNLLEKFLGAVPSEENPFSSDENSDEYTYYIQFRDFNLSRKNSRQSSEFDIAKNESNIQSLNTQIERLEYQLSGLAAYRNSIEQNINSAKDYPEYETMYLAYEQELAALKNDYENNQRQIKEDLTNEGNEHYLDYYRGLISGCEKLIESIEKGTSQFPEDSKDQYYLLYQEYVGMLSEYQRKYENARETYNYYLEGGSVGDNEENLLAYHKTMLEGYQYYLQSVKEDKDCFDGTNDSAFYRNQYIEYNQKYWALASEAQMMLVSLNSERQRLEELQKEFEALNAQEEFEGKQDALEALRQEIVNAEAAQAELDMAAKNAQQKADSFKAETIITIKNTISQIEATIAEKEIGIGNAAQDYNISIAKIQMDSAKEAIETYENDTLLEYRRAKAELENKIYDLQQALSVSTDKEERTSLLAASYEDAISQKRYQTLSQIVNAEQSLQRELDSVQANLRQYQLVEELYQNNIDESGTPISISQAEVRQISSIMDSIKNVELQIEEVDSQLKRAEEELRHGQVLAEHSGIVNAVSNVVNGDVITSGSVIATIIPINESKYKVQMYVKSADIGNVKIGDVIKYNISALPSSQYGNLTGEVLNISKDAVTMEGQYSGYFLVEGSISNTELHDSDGNIGKVTIGMQAEGKIVTQTKTIIRYLLEKINFF